MSHNTPLSASEIDSLAPSIGHTFPLSPDLCALLDPVVDLLRKDWVCRFLFTADPVHCTYLSSPTVTEKAILCETSITRVAATDPQPDPLGNSGLLQQIRGKYILVPALTIGALTVGVGVIDLVERSKNRIHAVSIHPQRSSCHNIRFVRDAAKGINLILQDSPDRNLMSMYISRLISTRNTSMVNAVLRRDQILTYIKTCGSLTQVGLARSIFTLSNESLLRPCPSCRLRNPTNSCSCSFPFIRPKHPYDVNPFLRAITNELGVYQGFVSLFGVTNNANYQGGILLGSHLQFQALNAPDIIRSYCNWSMSKYYQSSPPGPKMSQSLLPPSTGSQTATGKPSSEIYTLEGQNELQASFTCERSASEHGGLKAPRQKQPDDSMDKGSNSNVVCPGGESLAVLANDPLLTTDLSIQSENGNLPRASRHDDIVQLDPLERADVRNVIKQMKAEERKKRNRASALRSKRKKKEEREGLKAQLEMCKAQATLLRDKELLLRHENRDLKTALRWNVSQ